MPKVYLEPKFSGDDEGDGGVRRVVEAQERYLPSFGWEITQDLHEADVVNVHIQMEKRTERYLVSNPHVPFVLTTHGLYWAEYEWKKWAMKANAGVMKAVRLADAITAPSEWVAQAIRRNSLRDVVPIWHGIDLEEWPEPEEYGTGEFVLWNKNRIDPICDPEPMEKLAMRARNTKFVTTHDVKGESEDNVEVTGTLPYEKAKKLVREAGVYLCTTRETFGIGTLEAMASGVPILAFDWGGQREFVQHKKTGWLSPPGDLDDLEEGLKYCMKYRKRMGRAARKVVEKDFQWEKRIGLYADVFQQTLEEKAQKRPKVSIIVPAYGLDKLLPSALESVKAQERLKDWECIIVDDASPDKCGEIADAYAEADDRFKVIHNPTNEYLAGALNIGIEASKGEYILPLDADNRLPVETIRILAEALDRDRGIDIAYGNVLFEEPDGRQWHSEWPPEFSAEGQTRRDPDMDRTANYIPSGSMFRRKVHELTGGYRRRWKTAEDADFWTRAVSYGFGAERVTGLDTLIYRNREDSMSRVEETPDWSMWYPWSLSLAAPPAAIRWEPQEPVPSMEPVLISVVIPVGPGHGYMVQDAVDSVDSQTFRLFEVIVVNDTGEPLPVRLPNWVRVIQTSGKTGVAKARNLGIAASRAKLFCPLDADDTLEPPALARMHEAFLEFDGYVYSDFFQVWEDKPMDVWECPDYDANELVTRGALHAVTGLYQFKDWAALEGFDEELPAWEDWDFQLKLAAAGICGTRVPYPLFTYRKDTGFRREANYADFETSKNSLREKHHVYFDKEEELMGCSSCRGGGGGKITPVQQAMAAGAPAPPEMAEDYVEVEYTGELSGSQTLRAPSGQKYRFSSRPTERMKYVARGDASFFQNRRDFAVRERETTPA